MTVLSGNEVRVGVKVVIDDMPCEVLASQHVKIANRRAIIQATLRNLITGQVLNKTFHSGEKLDVADISTRRMQYLYNQGDEYVFMNTTTYEQVSFSREKLGPAMNYLKENAEVEVMYYNDNPVNINLPLSMELKVEHTEPGVRGDTATNVTKAATLETGIVVKVPLFINEGDVIKVDTRSGEYIERAQIG